MYILPGEGSSYQDPGAEIIISSTPPSMPTITGPNSGKSGNSYDYTFVSNDPNNDNVYYYIEWGDGTISDWLGPYDSGYDTTISHIWSEQGTYQIKAKAKDSHGEESEWSTYEISMPRIKSIEYKNPWLLRLIEKFPILKIFLK